MWKQEAPWESLPPVPMETGCCISLNVEHLKTGLCGRSPGMQHNEWLISVRETSLRVQTHTPLASGPAQVGDASRCCKGSVASFPSFTKICSLLLSYWPWENGSDILSNSNSASLKPNHVLLIVESGRKEKGEKVGKWTSSITLRGLATKIAVCVCVCVFYIVLVR